MENGSKFSKHGCAIIVIFARIVTYTPSGYPPERAQIYSNINNKTTEKNEKNTCGIDGYQHDGVVQE